MASKTMLTKPQAAAHLNISVMTLERIIKKGVISTLLVGREIRLIKEDLPEIKKYHWAKKQAVQ